MRIYFAGSIRGGRDDSAIYMKLIEKAGRYGEVLTEHVGSVGEEDLTDTDIFARDLEWLRTADAVVAEVTTPSLGVGYEIGMAQAWGIPTLCLFRHGSSRRLSAILSGNSELQVTEYSALDEALESIGVFLTSVRA
jgi:nucleoside 2-deoxyribosyltransferase